MISKCVWWLYKTSWKHTSWPVTLVKGHKRHQAEVTRVKHGPSSSYIVPQNLWHLCQHWGMLHITVTMKLVQLLVYYCYHECFNIVVLLFLSSTLKHGLNIVWYFYVYKVRLCTLIPIYMINRSQVAMIPF